MIDRRDFIKTLAFGAVSAGFPKLLKAAELPRPGGIHWLRQTG